MRVSFSGNAFLLNRSGGVTRYFVRLAEELEALGVEPLVATVVHRNQHLAVSRVRRGIELSERVEALRLGPVWRALNDRRLALDVSRARPDLHHATYYTSPVVRRVRNVITVFDLIHERYPEQFAKGDDTARRKRRWCAEADLVLAISGRTRQDLIDLLDVDAQKVVVTHLGVDHGGPAHPRPRRRPYLLYVGTRRGYKNCDRLLAAFAALPSRSDLDLVLFGGGPLTADERRRVRDLGIDGEVICRGGDDATLAAHYQHAVALVYPSLYEGFGLPPLEAMAASCPVLCSNTPAVEEVVGSAALMFDPVDTEALTSALAAIVHDEEVRRRLVLAGPRRAAAYSWSATADATLAAYRNLL